MTGIGPSLSLEVVAESTKPPSLALQKLANGPFEMVADEPHERNWLLYVCALCWSFVFYVSC
jgi:hypothetical protein